MWASKTYTFSPSTTAKSAEVNQNFDDMVDQLNMAMPSGSIIMWSGSIASVPAGYFLCDGDNGTPDLRGRMVVGAGAGTGLTERAVNDIGGEEAHVLTTAEIPNNGAQKWGGTRQADQTTTTISDVAGKGIGFIPATYGDGGHNNMPPFYALAFIMKS